MRLFFASFLSPENQGFHESLVKGLRAEVPRTLRPVPSGSQHLTLAFLGEIPDRDLEIHRTILSTLQTIPAIPIELAPPRILSSRGTPRLLCADLSAGSEQVVELQQLLCREILSRRPGLAVDPKPPHVTLARFRRGARGKEARRVAASLSRWEGSTPSRADRVAQVALVRSTLTPGGPVYETTGEVALPPARLDGSGG